MGLIVKNLSYVHPDRESLFGNISFSVAKGQKVSLTGDNGTGKSTLLQIIAGELEASSGEISIDGNLYYVPQHFGQFGSMTVAEALRINKKTNALRAILEGNASEENFALLEDDWAVEERVSAAFSSWGLQDICLARRMDTLSGGEKTKLFLSGIDIHSPSVILMDEPTNHLDTEYRGQLYELLQSSGSTMLIVSHDRILLNMVDVSCELTKNGIEVYGGNYEFYRQQKDGRIRALHHQLEAREKELRHIRKTARETAERKQKQDMRGEKKSLKKGISRIMMNSLKNRAEESTAKLKNVHAEKTGDISEDIRQIRKEIPESGQLKLDFEDARLHDGKILVTCGNINFGYSERMLWRDPLNFRILSGDRFVIKGNNGSGKTTLLRLITGKLTPSCGFVERADFKYVYIDQEYSIIRNELTVYDQAESFNERHLPEHEVKTLLNRFLLPYPVWNKTCNTLSGGEKMKLLLCCLAVGNKAPDMFVLDEPTNNIDIRGLEMIASALKSYRGTVVLISHDQYFIDEMNISHVICL
jgi:ATPase subunit of ABC transporter with duplicated ATPase domains